MDTKLYRALTIPAGGATVNIDPTDPIQHYRILGTGVALAGAYTIQMGAGTIATYMRVIFDYRATVTLGAFSLTILGQALSAVQALHRATIVAEYYNAAWSVTVYPDFTDTGFIEVAQIPNAIITLAKLATQADSTLLGNNSGGAASPTAIAIADNTLVGRNGGNIAAIALAVQQILLRGAGNIAATTIGAGEMVGRPAAGNLGAMTMAQVLAGLPLPDGQMLVGLAGVPTARTMSGLFTVSNTGVATKVDYQISEQIYVTTTNVTNVGGAGLETLATYTIPAGVLSVNGDAVEIIACGTTAATANAKSIRINFFGTDIAINNTTGSPNAVFWKYHAIIYRIDNINVKCSISIIFNGAPATVELDYSTVGGLDLAGAVTVTSLLASGAGAGDTTTMYAYEVRLIKG